MRLKRLVYSGAPYLHKLHLKLRERRQPHAAQFRRLKEVFYEKLWADTARALGAEIKPMGYGFFQLRLRERTTLVHGAEVMLDNHLNLKVAGNKPLINKMLAEQNYPVARYFEFDWARLDEAYAFLKTLTTPGVVKPADSGSAGKGITTGIETRAQLRQAALWAGCFSPQLLLESQVEGDSYRLLFLRGRFLDAIKRNPPRVRGDGKSNIQELIAKENDTRLHGGEIISLHPLTLDAELRRYLAANGHDLKHVLKAGESLAVKRVVNQNARSENESVRARVHPDLIAGGERIAALLQIELAGLDLLCKDLTQPLTRSNGVINEINTTPALHHHYLISEPAQIVPVALHIQRHILHVEE